MPKSIVLIHAAAIGDAVLATPVLVSLRRAYPDAKIVYVAHSSVFELIGLTDCVDNFVEWDKSKSVFAQAQQLREFGPELVIDLVASMRSRIVCALINAKTLRYRKNKSASTQMHAAENFMQTIHSLKIDSAPYFPTLKPRKFEIDRIRAQYELDDPVVVIVPGVGKNRPSRAWPREYWKILAGRMQDMGCCIGIVGGADEADDCLLIASELRADRTVNLAGKLTLSETATYLSLCKLVISGDTGPAHIAVAVGKDVIGLMGPTAPQRSGPYGMESIGLDACGKCDCESLKYCRQTDGSGPGSCMTSIDPEDVLGKYTEWKLKMRGAGCT